MTHSDSHFVIGKSHTICQDYAVAAPNYVILSDGCSSSKDSDFGARFLVKSAEALMPRWSLFNDTWPSAVIMKAQYHSGAVELSSDCLCATLLAVKTDGKDFSVSVAGDGVLVARRRKTGRYQIISTEYPSGAPFYLRYLLDQDCFGAYAEQFGYKLKQVYYEYLPDKNEINKLDEIVTDKYTDRQLSLWPFEEYDMVAILSDGVHSFMKTVETSTARYDVAVPFTDVLKELLAFKTYNGCFVQRRMKRVLEPIYNSREKWVNTDDLSMGVIYVE